MGASEDIDELAALAAQIAALKMEVERLKAIPPILIKADQSTEQLSREKVYQDVIKQLQRDYKAETDSLYSRFEVQKIENARLSEALLSLKHLNNHTIEEEMWRIDKALGTEGSSDALRDIIGEKDVVIARLRLTAQRQRRLLILCELRMRNIDDKFGYVYPRSYEVYTKDLYPRIAKFKKALLGAEGSEK